MLTHTGPPTATATDLTLEHVGQAREAIPPMFLDTPQYEDEGLSAVLGRRVTVKLETGNPLRSFKGRGVGYALRHVGAGDLVVCASWGNFGQAVAFVGRSRGADVRVYAPAPVNPVKLARMIAFGAEVVEVGDMQEARDAAASAATRDRTHLLLDGIPPALAEGAATMAEELTRAGGVDGGAFDAVVVPIGDGSLISGIALWARAHAPATRIIGVNSASAPAMHDSRLTGRPVTVAPTSPFAEGLTIPRPHPESLARISRLVDDIVLVEEHHLRRAMSLIAEHLSILAEPAGAAGIAAIAAGLVDGGNVATIVTGANPNPGVSAHIA